MPNVLGSKAILTPDPKIPLVDDPTQDDKITEIKNKIGDQKFKEYRTVLLSQYPMMVLMILYTMLSLWMIAQPIVETG